MPWQVRKYIPYQSVLAILMLLAPTLSEFWAYTIPVVPLPLIVIPLPFTLTLLLRLMVPFLLPEFRMLTVPELMAATQALAAAAILVPVYLVVPSTLPVQVLPERVT